MAAFLNRDAELSSLEQAWSAPGAQLILVWGRRRTGKTRLLGRFIRERPAVYYGATEQAPAAELAALSEATRRALSPQGTDLLVHGDFPSWDAALAYYAERARHRKLVVVLDEFSYLVESEPALPSIVQRFWDQQRDKTKLKLVLCGSAQTVMEELQSQRAPLFGRVDTRLHLFPFRFDEAALFMPRLEPVERALAYGVLGGMPTYLARWRDGVGHRANLRRLFGDVSSPLLEEGELVLSSELHEGAGYLRILRAIAGGHRTYGAIKQFADMEVQRQLEQLLRLRLVERITPVTEDPNRTKLVQYRIADNFLAFWFRFIYRHRADIARGLGREIVDRTIVPALPEHMGMVWEEMCRELIRRKAAEGTLPVEVSSVGCWWNRDHSVEIDVVGLDGKRVVLVGSAKWNRRVPAAELSRLRRAAEALPRRADQLTFALFGREQVDATEALAFTARDFYPQA